MNIKDHKGLLFQFKNIQRDQRGSFTLEASLIFPTIFLLIIAFLFVSIVMYQKVTLYYIASQAAERAAYNWDNSFKAPLSGEFSIGQNDGLYWRLTNDGVLELILGVLPAYSSPHVDINSISTPRGLAERKLKNMADEMPGGIQGSITYKNHVIDRKVLVELEKPLKIPSFVSRLIGEKVVVEASSTVVDPVEFIRNVAFVIEYKSKVMDLGPKSTDILKKQEKTDK